MITREQLHTSEPSERFRNFAEYIGKTRDPVCKDILDYFGRVRRSVSVPEIGENIGRPEDVVRYGLDLLVEPNPSITIPIKTGEGEVYRLSKYAELLI